MFQAKIWSVFLSRVIVYKCSLANECQLDIINHCKSVKIFGYKEDMWHYFL